jgi:hypothetical protein
LWLGEDSLKDKTILIYGEQGMGDIIQFLRYITFFRDMATKIILEVPKGLVSLCLNLLPQNFQVISDGQEIPEFDYYCPIMSFPCAFKTTIQTIPNQFPYLFVPEDKKIKWEKILGNKKIFRVGLAWSGQKGRHIDKNPCRNRSIPIHFFKELIDLPIEFHSLQIEFRSEEDVQLAKKMGIKIHSSQIKDFSDTAAIMSEMDLILSIDTSVAHLAGALGMPVWVMLPFSTDYRWTIDQDVSPWYSTSKLFRADKVGNWSYVLDSVKKALSLLLPNTV